MCTYLLLYEFLTMCSDYAPCCYLKHQQKLELTCDRVSGDPTISEMKKDPTSATYIPVRIREILRDTLSPSKWDLSTLPSTSSLPQAEQSSPSSVFLNELKQAQGRLSQMEKDCMELSVKYISVNEKVRVQLATGIVN